MSDRFCTKTRTFKRILHRDLKPGNIVVLNTQDGDLVKIVDFGIARLLSDNPDHRLTRKGDIVGSPVYMSPEQCRAEDVDQCSDMYSFGCVMYEIIAGHPPLRGATSLKTIQKHNNELPKSPAAQRKGCPKQLEQIVMRCLANLP